MKVAVVCNDGSPLGVTLASLRSEGGRSGVGGAELALLTLCEYWGDKGYDVTLYNDPKPYDQNTTPFIQRPISEFNPNDERDICITFRSPNPRTSGEVRGKKVWWSCDQYTIGDFKSFSLTQDEIVCISPFHSQYFNDRYGIQNTVNIDLPVRISEYDEEVILKSPKQCLFSSVPDRGLPLLASMWPLISERVPDANLVITSGWSLWTGQDDTQLLWPYRMLFQGQRNVDYRGAISRKELVKVQKQSSLLTYPSIYQELFCYAVAEAQVAGAYPIVSTIGALETTNMGTRLFGEPTLQVWKDRFVDEVCKKLENLNLSDLQIEISKEARERFSLERIGKLWDENVFC